MQVTRIVSLASVIIFSFFVALIVAGSTLWSVVASRATDAYENLFIVALVTLVATFVAALAISRRPRVAGAVAAVITTVVVGGGLVVIFAIYASWCGNNSSSC